MCLCRRKNEYIDLGYENLALIFVNTYARTLDSLKDGPVNDGQMTYDGLTKLGYKPYLFKDVKRKRFKELMTTFLSAETKKLVIYFTGHGASVKDKNGAAIIDSGEDSYRVNGDESDGYDEAFVFRDGIVLDDVVLNLISTFNKSKQLTIITDSCHSGSICDLDDNKDILTISAAHDKEEAMQVYFKKDKQTCGCFTYYFWKYINENRDTKTLIPLINEKLQKYKHQCRCNHECDFIL